MFLYPDYWKGIEGWLTIPEGEYLQQQAEGKIVLEIGTFKGRSSYAMAASAKKVITVDWHLGDAGVSAPSMKDYFEQYEPSPLRYRVIPIVGSIPEVLPFLKPIFTMAFIDGAHAEADVRRDIRLARSLLLPGSSMFFHDWGYESVRTAAFGEGLCPVPVVDQIARHIV